MTQNHWVLQGIYYPLYRHKALPVGELYQARCAIALRWCFVPLLPRFSGACVGGLATPSKKKLGFPNPKNAQHSRLTLEEAITQYDDSLLTAASSIAVTFKEVQ